MQDVFEAGFIPSDTDYRMFSAAAGQLGRWPGLDIAHILDSATYHTRQDSLERLRPGILQASPTHPPAPPFVNLPLPDCTGLVLFIFWTMPPTTHTKTH